MEEKKTAGERLDEYVDKYCYSDRNTRSLLNGLAVICEQEGIDFGDIPIDKIKSLFTNCKNNIFFDKKKRAIIDFYINLGRQDIAKVINENINYNNAYVYFVNIEQLAQYCIDVTRKAKKEGSIRDTQVMDRAETIFLLTALGMSTEEIGDAKWHHYSYDNSEIIVNNRIIKIPPITNSEIERFRLSDGYETGYFNQGKRPRYIKYKTDNDK